MKKLIELFILLTLIMSLPFAYTKGVKLADKIYAPITPLLLGPGGPDMNMFTNNICNTCNLNGTTSSTSCYYIEKR